MSAKKRHKKICICLVILLLIGTCLSIKGIPVYAAKDEKTIRVGVYELEGFHSFENNGTCVGYDVDYLNRISNYTGWKYEYVKAESWSDAIKMLENGQIDILSPSQMTTERLNEFGFSTFPIGEVYAAILTLESNKTTYEDFKAFSKMTFGIERGNTYQKIFEDYAKSYNFKAKIKFYSNHTQLVNAVKKGEVDAMVANVMRAEPNMRLLGKAGTAQYYYMYRKGDVELGNELNDALNQIEIDEPNFQSELVNAYFPIYNEEPFTKAEMNYVKKLPTIRVACPSGAFPNSYMDQESGEMVGITIDYLKKSGKTVGLNYEFVPCTLDEITSDYIKDNNIQLVVESGLTPLEKNRKKGVYSNNILDTQQLIVCSPKTEYSTKSNLTIAWYGINNIPSENVKQNFPNFKWKSYDSMKACLDAVKAGKVDGCMINQFAANWYLSQPSYENFVMITNSSIPQSICLKAGETIDGFDPSDSTFIGILNKSFKQISYIEEQQITIEHTTARPYELTLTDRLYKDRYVVMLFVAVIMFGVLLFYFMQKRKNESALKEKNIELGRANKTKSEFLSRMSHELRTPLNALEGYAELIQQNINSDAPNTEDQLENLTHIQDASKYLLRVIDDILEIQNMKQEKRTVNEVPVNVEKYIDNLFIEISREAEEKGIKFSVERLTKLNEWYMLDDVRCAQIIMNVLHNAMKFTPKGGTVKMTLEGTALEDNLTEIKAVISDTGIGMSKDFLENKIFTNFAQEDQSLKSPYEGCGVGLALSKDLVDLMGGTITCESEKGKGSTFTITIKAESFIPESEKSKPEKKEMIYDLSGIRVLLCEDNPTNQNIERKILEKMKCEVDIAEDGQVGVSIMENCDENYYDIILMDIRMPNLDGLEAAKAIRSLKRKDVQSIPILAVSANAFEEDVKASLEAGMNAHIAKPVGANIFYEKIKEYAMG